METVRFRSGSHTAGKPVDRIHDWAVMTAPAGRSSSSPRCNNTRVRKDAAVVSAAGCVAHVSSGCDNCLGTRVEGAGGAPRCANPGANNRAPGQCSAWRRRSTRDAPRASGAARRYSLRDLRRTISKEDGAGLYAFTDRTLAEGGRRTKTRASGVGPAKIEKYGAVSGRTASASTKRKQQYYCHLDEGLFFQTAFSRAQEWVPLAKFRAQQEVAPVVARNKTAERSSRISQMAELDCSASVARSWAARASI